VLPVAGGSGTAADPDGPIVTTPGLSGLAKPVAELWLALSAVPAAGRDRGVGCAMRPIVAGGWGGFGPKIERSKDSEPAEVEASVTALTTTIDRFTASPHRIRVSPHDRLGLRHGLGVRRRCRRGTATWLPPMNRHPCRPSLPRSWASPCRHTSSIVFGRQYPSSWWRICCPWLPSRSLIWLVSLTA
jgi:hypothetical protein